ncbi:MAG: class C sortase [Coriobacteriales bacterium]|nr:class C sortase [Coriobacteriales bacterium]
MAFRTNIFRHVRRPSPSTALIVLLLVLGSAIMAYPTISDWWNSYHQTRAIATYAAAVESTDPELIEAMLLEAEDYNTKLAHEGSGYAASEVAEEDYDRLLNLDGNGVMGYIQVKRLKIDYPIYHGTEERVLQMAIGHLVGTSLPVGGTSTHAVVTGHRGMPSAKLFTDLDRMFEGDTFTITVLNRTLTYEVDQIRIVEPEDMSDLTIDDGKDYVTLVTCTPYGINTHRLLVRGHRIDNVAGQKVIPADAVQIPNYIAVPAVAIPMLFVYLVGALVWYGVKGRSLSHVAALAALRRMEGDDDRDGTA